MGQKELTNAEWLNHLQSDGLRQVETIENLRQLLLRAALYTMHRNLSDLNGHSQAEALALAEDCAQDALIAILRQLGEFRGESRFTTWAYKFAVHKALETARREHWKGRSLDPLLEETNTCKWVLPNSVQSGDPEAPAVQTEVWQIVRQVICLELTERQRQVFKLMVFDEVPMDVVAERLDTNRNAIYKMLHDARKKMRHRLQEHGYTIHEILELFSVSSPIENKVQPEGECL